MRSPLRFSVLPAAWVVALAAALATSSCKDDEAKGSEPIQVPPKEVFDAAGEAPKRVDGTDYVPAEFKGKKGKWRDPGVYVDGQLVAYLWWAELPADLEVTWIDDVEALDFGPGHKGPKTKPIKVRRYRFADYLEAIDIDLKKVKELHIYGGGNHTVRITGRDLRRHRDGLQFAFGREMGGKPLFYPPEGLEVNTTFDQAQTIAVYVDKKAPVVNDEDRVEQDGELVEGIPYYGKPMRGGIRFYLDDRLGTVLKRNSSDDLEPLESDTESGDRTFSLFGMLEQRGVDPETVVEGYLVHEDVRGEALDRATLESLTFVVSPRARGHILVGDSGAMAQAVMLYSRPVDEFRPAEARSAAE